MPVAAYQVQLYRNRDISRYNVCQFLLIMPDIPRVKIELSVCEMLSLDVKLSFFFEMTPRGQPVHKGPVYIICRPNRDSRMTFVIAATNHCVPMNQLLFQCAYLVINVSSLQISHAFLCSSTMLQIDRSSLLSI